MAEVTVRIEFSSERSASLPRAVELLERLAIEEALKESGGHRERAAKMLGLARPTLYMMCVRLNIITPREKQR